jgi:hypothetical protein
VNEDVQAHVAACETCQQSKYEARTPAGVLQPLPVPTQVWEDISLDFIEGLPMSAGTNVLMVMVDRLKKYTHFTASSHPHTAQRLQNFCGNHCSTPWNATVNHECPYILLASSGKILSSYRIWSHF